jgi:hypothetical protein
MLQLRVPGNWLTEKSAELPISISQPVLPRERPYSKPQCLCAVAGSKYAELRLRLRKCTTKRLTVLKNPAHLLGRKEYGTTLRIFEIPIVEQ